jgi:hypothetical protein
MAKYAKALAAAAALICLLSFRAPPLSAAGVAVPSLELVTRGAMLGSVFAIQSRGSLALAVEGGYKFGATVLLGYTNAPLEPFQSPTGLDFRGIDVTVEEIGSTPLSLTFFIGENDTFCSGDEFTAAFGSDAIMTHYRGFLTFPNGIAGQPNVAYDGIHQVKGTGLRLSLAPPDSTFLLFLYGYQDSRFTDLLGNLLPGYYSTDLRTLIAAGPVKFEAFLGATYSPVSAYGYYRGGLLFHAQGPGVEFLAQIGVPKFAPATDPVSMDLLYVLFEPRVHLGLFSIVPTFFWHPGFYLQQPTGETGSFDVNLDMYVGDIATTSIRGGLQGALRFASAESSFIVTASPYVSFITPGILWDFRVDVRLAIPFGLDDLAGTVGIRAEL